MNTECFVFSVKNNSTLLEQALCFTPGNRAFHSEVALSSLGEGSLSPDQLWSSQWHQAAFLEFFHPAWALQWTTSGSLSSVDSARSLCPGVRCLNLLPSLKTYSWVTTNLPLRSSTQVNWVCGESCDSLKYVKLSAELFLFLWCLFLIAKTWLVNQYLLEKYILNNENVGFRFEFLKP